MPLTRTSVGVRRNASLDGLRGMAALAVVFTHTVVHLGLFSYAPLGAIGVLVFFVLSGYLIGGISWRTLPSGAAYRRFVRRRVDRLAPVVVALAVVGGPVLATLGHLAPSDVLRDAVFALTQTSAFAQASGVEVAPAFAPTWSLTIEWTFYLSFPVALWWFRRILISPSRVWRMLAGIAVFLYTVGLFLSPRLFYLLPVANLGVLYAGGALAIWHAQWSEFGGVRSDPGRTGVALLFLTVLVFLPGHTLGWGWKASIFPASVVAALLVIHGCRAGDLVAGLLAKGVLPMVGLRAYSLYLWHMPILWLVWIGLPDLPRWAMAGVAVCIVGIVTEGSFWLLERPVLHNGPGRRAHR